MVIALAATEQDKVIPPTWGSGRFPRCPLTRGHGRCHSAAAVHRYQRTVQIQQWKTHVQLSFLYRFRQLFRLGCAEIMIWCGRRRDWEISGIGRLASWQFLVRSFPNAGAEKWEGGEGWGGTIQKERKNVEMEKGLKMGISCACLWQKGNKHAQINNGLIWKAFILWDARLIFFFTFF